MGWARCCGLGVTSAQGMFFSGELETLASHLTFLGRGLFAALLTVLLLYIGRKYSNRRRFLHQLRIARISPEELRQKMSAGEDIVVADLRHAL
jgi:hypothetical protein